MKKLILAMAVLSFGKALAYLPPDLSLRRTELVQILPYAQVARLQNWVPQQSVLLSPAEYLEKLYAQFPDHSLAWTFYASWEYLELLEKTQQGYDQREDDLARGEELLAAYIERCNAVEGTSARPLPLQLASPETRPQIEENDDHLRVFRVLPWPERGYTRAQVQQLLDAARADLSQVQAQQARLEEARKAFVGRQEAWTAWLTDVAESSRKFTQAQYMKPYDDLLPPPPREPAASP